MPAHCAVNSDATQRTSNIIWTRPERLGHTSGANLATVRSRLVDALLPSSPYGHGKPGEAARTSRVDRTRHSRLCALQKYLNVRKDSLQYVERSLVPI